MSAPRRSVSKLLADTYSRFCASEGGYITDCIYEVWESTRSGEAVICEAFVSLEKAAREITKTRRITFCQVEDDTPESIPSLFRAAIAMTESRRALELDL